MRLTLSHSLTMRFGTSEDNRVLRDLETALTRLMVSASLSAVDPAAFTARHRWSTIKSTYVRNCSFSCSSSARNAV
jgi:hypothetical protein